MSKGNTANDSNDPLTTETVEFLTKAGADNLLLRVAEERVAGRNSAREEIRKYASHGMLTGESEEFHHMGGHFFGALWDGELFEAWVRADAQNKRILRQKFTEKELIQAGVEDGRPRGYCERMVRDK